MIKVYGIPNCDTMKKARRWLDANGLDYDFHDYKKQGVPQKELKRWIKQAGWETVLNKRGTTWRKLDDRLKDNIDNDSALTIMLDNPGIIKRPVVESAQLLLIGFNEDDYKRFL